jgi:hypothetical protein
MSPEDDEDEEVAAAFFPTPQQHEDEAFLHCDVNEKDCVHVDTKQGKKFYTMVRVLDLTVKVGDIVRVKLKDDAYPDACCQVLAVFEDENARNTQLEVRWFKRPAELSNQHRKTLQPELSRSGAFLENELVETMVLDDIPVGSIIEKVELRGYDQARKRKAEDTAGPEAGTPCSVYYLRFFEMKGTVTMQMVSMRTLYARGMKMSHFRYAYKDAGLVDAPDALIASVPTDKFSVAIRKLHVSVLPNELPCRTLQRETIQSAIREAIVDSNLTRALYISGMPGTGKTATVIASMRSLLVEARRQQIPMFNYCEINCLRLHTPADAYTCLWRHLQGSYGSSKVALQHLTDHFQKRSDSYGKKNVKRETLVCLVDEMDFLITTDESVVYNFFNWAVMPGSGLLLVGVSNIMDLPERLSGRYVGCVHFRAPFAVFLFSNVPLTPRFSPRCSPSPG